MLPFLASLYLIHVQEQWFLINNQVTLNISFGEKHAIT